MSTAVILFLALAAWFFSKAIKSIKKDERLVLFANGEPSRVVGAGKVFVMPILQSWKLIDLRSKSLPLPEAKPNEAKYPLVKGIYEFQIVDALKASTKENVQASTEELLHSVLLASLSPATIRQCLVESFILEQKVLEDANAQTKAWGVRIGTIKFNEFPLHRRLAAQLAGIPAELLVEIAIEIEKIAEMNFLTTPELNYPATP